MEKSWTQRKERNKCKFSLKQTECRLKISKCVQLASQNSVYVTLQKKKKRKESLYAFCLTNVTRFMAYFFFFHPFSFKIKNLCILVMHEKINLNIKSVH